MSETRKAVVLLSGGLDSATALAIAIGDGYEPCAMSFRYGQRHAVELGRAKATAAQQGVRRHVVVDIDLRAFGGSALTADIDVPKARATEEMSHGIPITYVPARNTIFLSFALAWAETLSAQDRSYFYWSQRAGLQRLPRLPARIHRRVLTHGEPWHKARCRRQSIQNSRTADSVKQGADYSARPGAGRGLRADEFVLRPSARRGGVRKVRLVPVALKGISRSGACRSGEVRGVERPE